jgi:uncharacterized protein YbaR (Trm112 family)
MNKDLLDILICPACKSTLKLNEAFLHCTHGSCRRKYAIKNDIPVMLIEESEIVDEKDFDRIMQL